MLRRSTTIKDYSSRELPDGLEEYPDAPRRAFPDEPEIIAREPSEQQIERRPLDNGADRPAVTEAPAATPNIVEGAIDPSLGLGAREDVAALQILLDRRGASPGVIDGRFGSNVDKAIVSYRSITKEDLKSTDAAGIKKALAASGGDPFINYTLTAADVAGSFVASIPDDYGEKAKLEKLSYTSVTEMLAERFHMDESYLKSLNSDANFSRVGTIIRVANIGQPSTRQVAKIVADKGEKQVFAYDADNKLVASYPATIGSTDTPSPSGTHLISRVVLDPDYTYNPEHQLQAGREQQDPDHSAGPERACGFGMDRARQADLRRARHARAVEDRQGREPWLRAPHQLGRAGTRQAGENRRPGRVRRIDCGRRIRRRPPTTAR